MYVCDVVSGLIVKGVFVKRTATNPPYGGVGSLIFVYIKTIIVTSFLNCSPRGHLVLHGGWGSGYIVEYR